MPILQWDAAERRRSGYVFLRVIKYSWRREAMLEVAARHFRYQRTAVERGKRAGRRLAIPVSNTHGRDRSGDPCVRFGPGIQHAEDLRWRSCAFPVSGSAWRPPSIDGSFSAPGAGAGDGAACLHGSFTMKLVKRFPECSSNCTISPPRSPNVPRSNRACRWSPSSRWLRTRRRGPQYVPSCGLRCWTISGWFQPCAGKPARYLNALPLMGVATESVPDNLPDEYKTCIYRVVQEALHNCSRHSRATTVRIRVQQDARRLLSIQDDGQGFDVKQSKGMGLLGDRGTGDSPGWRIPSPLRGGKRYDDDRDAASRHGESRWRKAGK